MLVYVLREPVESLDQVLSLGQEAGARRQHGDSEPTKKAVDGEANDATIGS